MFVHYLVTALRHFRRHKVTTVINVACLAMGLACFVLAWGATAYYEKADSYHERAKRTYFVTSHQKGGFTLPGSPWVLADALRAEFPQLEFVARSLASEELPVMVGDQSSFVYVAFADPDFTRVFDLPLLTGNATTALDAPRSAIVSVALAERLFGDESGAVGRTIRLASREDVTITGVVSSIPQPSQMSTDNGQAQLYFEALVSMDTHEALVRAAKPDDTRVNANWTSVNYMTYLVFPERGALLPGELDSQLDAFTRRRASTADASLEFRIHPMAALTGLFFSMFVGADSTGISSTAILKILGGLVLLVSCLNYANLATAQAATQAKEVALKKVVGASAWQLMRQYFVEASVLVWLALGIAILGILLGAMSAGSATSAGLAILFGSMPQFWGFLVVLTIAVSALAGAYPAFALSRVRPIFALRSAHVTKGSRLVAILVGLQFGSASFLMVTLIVMLAQNESVQSSIASSAEDPVIVIANNTEGVGLDRAVFKDELLKMSGIVAVSGIQGMPWVPTIKGIGIVTATAEFTGNSGTYVNRIVVAEDFFSALKIPILAGREFERDRADDTTDIASLGSDSNRDGQGVNVVIDRSLAQKLGYTPLEDAIGKVIYNRPADNASTPPSRLNVIGVAKDSTLKPLSYGTSSYYVMNHSSATIPLVRISRGNLESTLSGMDSLWHRLVPSEPIKRRFGDEQFEASFGFLNAISGIIAILAGFAVAIAAMGLVGMALHVIRRRTREIGVRKTLGASVGEILVLLLRGFSKPVVIANIAAWPIAYLAMSGYLSMFANSSGLTPLPFVASLVLTLLLAWLAVVVQATRAAQMKLGTLLRHE